MQSEGLFVVDGDIPSIKVRVVNAWLGGVLPLTVVAEGERKEVLQKNLFNSLPFAETDLGVASSPDQIMRLLARKSNKMYGEDSWETAEVDGWLEYVSRMISLPVREIVQQQSGQRKNNQEKVECAKQMLAGSCEAVDRHLSMRTYLVGERPTIADVSLFVELAAIKQVLLGGRWQHLERWMQHIQSLPVFPNEGLKTQLDQINQRRKPQLSKQQTIRKEQETAPVELPPKETSTEPLLPGTVDTQPN